MLEIEGHTDDRGDAVYDERVSLERADMIRNILVRQGVPQRCDLRARIRQVAPHSVQCDSVGTGAEPPRGNHDFRRADRQYGVCGSRATGWRRGGKESKRVKGPDGTSGPIGGSDKKNGSK